MRAYELPFTEYVSVAVCGRVLAGTTGFQSPADDYEQSRIDLAKELVTTIASVFCMRVEGGSMEDAGIRDGDILVCDRARTPKSGDVVIADVNELRVVKRLRVRSGRATLLAEAKDHKAIEVDPEQGVVIVAVVVHAVRTL